MKPTYLKSGRSRKCGENKLRSDKSEKGSRREIPNVWMIELLEQKTIRAKQE